MISLLSQSQQTSCALAIELCVWVVLWSCFGRALVVMRLSQFANGLIR